MNARDSMAIEIFLSFAILVRVCIRSCLSNIRERITPYFATNYNHWLYYNQ